MSTQSANSEVAPASSETVLNERITAIVPARDEEASIEACVRSLARQAEIAEIFVVDDHSADRTAEIVRGLMAEFKNLRLLEATEIPAGWLGKNHALWEGAKRAASRVSNLAELGRSSAAPLLEDRASRWLLFTDADVHFRPDVLPRALAYAEAESADHLVLLPRMIMHSPGEKMMIAFFQTLFVFGHRPWKVADPKTKDHMGVGAFNLIRRRVYDALGTYQALRFEVLDDMKLGKIVKNAGYAQRNVFGADLISLRWAKGAMGMVDNLTKNFFAIMSFQWWRALLSAFALAFLNLMPFLGIWLAHGWARLPYAVALASMFAIYVGMSWKSDVPAYYFALHPISTLLFVYTMLRSMGLTLARGGIVWRGTFYPLEELRRGMV